MTPALTTAQLQTLKTYIAGQPDLSVEPNNDDGNFNIAGLLNKPDAVAYLVWRNNVLLQEVTGRSAFDWTRVDNLSVGKARIWEWMFDSGSCNPSLDNVRAGVNATFSTAGTDAPNRQSFFDASVRQVTRVERRYATGTGSAPNDTGVGPGKNATDGPITPAEVAQARNLP